MPKHLLLIKRKIKFNHTHNLLTDVWFANSTSKNYPSSIWFAMNEKAFLDDYNNSINYYVRLRFESLLSSDSKKERQKIETKIFGKSGDYTVEELQLRLDMLNLVAVGVGLINHDLKLFTQEITDL